MMDPQPVLTGFAATLWIFMGMDVMGQGSLTPPGAPGETMKTLGHREVPLFSLDHRQFLAANGLHSTS